MVTKLVPILVYARPAMRRACAAIAIPGKELVRPILRQTRILRAGLGLQNRAMIMDLRPYANPTYALRATAERAKRCALVAIKSEESAAILTLRDSAAANAKESMNRAGVATKERYEIRPAPAMGMVLGRDA